jgi:hypothetical protein
LSGKEAGELENSILFEPLVVSGQKEASQGESDSDGVAIVEGSGNESGQEECEECKNPGPFG